MNQLIDNPIKIGDSVILYNDDCLDSMRCFGDNSFDTIITDPPYGLSFMGKKWDYQVPSIEIWQECLRVLKPGGTALIFAGSRTQHRMACNVEDAGFILKDCIMWIYGSGFPKSADVSKNIDKMKGCEREVIGQRDTLTGSDKETNWKNSSPRIMDVTVPKSNEAQLWNGWKSHGLKPAYEPILVAMKPNDGTYASNALKHGVSGLNIDGGRIPIDKDAESDNRVGTDRVRGDKKGLDSTSIFPGTFTKDGVQMYKEQGRCPANVILDEEAGRLLDEQSGTLKSGALTRSETARAETGKHGKYGKFKGCPDGKHFESSSGGASRFFYCAKASKSERNAGCEGLEEKPMEGRDIGQDERNTPHKSRTAPRQNSHPTVKPLSLMQYLCTLTATPTGGIVCDPFMGSGTTGIAAINTGRQFIGIELEEDYFKIAQARIDHAIENKELMLEFTS